MSTRLNSEQLKNFDRLKIEQEKYLFSISQNLKKWNNYKADYMVLKNRLETLPHELKYDVMVPVTKKAFMPGKLVNTNEILVLLGENWFVERSAKQACEIIDRRLVSIDKHIDEHNRESVIYKDQINWTDNLIKEKSDFVEIEEKLEDVKPSPVKPNKKLSEEEIKELRRKQQERALKAQEAINQELKKARDGMFSSIEDEVNEEEAEVVKPKESKLADLNFMDQLKEQIDSLDNGVKFDQEAELLEAEKTLTGLINDYEKNIDRANNSAIEKLLLEKSKKQVKWSDSNEHLEQVAEDDNEEEDYDYVDDDDDNEVEYTDSDDQEEDGTKPTESKTNPAAVIKIRHTKSEMLDEVGRRHRLSRDKPALDNPGDIYNVFYKPKSILKNKDEPVDSLSESKKSSTPTEKTEKTVKEPKNVLNEKFEPEKAFSGEIVERAPTFLKKTDSNFQQGNSGSTLATTEPTKKLVSKFKASKSS